MENFFTSPSTTLLVLPLLFFTLNKLWEYFVKRKDRLRADYDLAEKLMTDDRWKDMPDFQLELGYQGLSKKRIKASIIRFFLSRENEYQNLLDFSTGKRFLKVNERENKIFSISLHEKLRDAKKLKVKRLWISVYYYVFSSLGFLPYFLLVLGYSEQSEGGNLPIWVLIVIWVTYFWMLAYHKLLAVNALRAAERIHEKFGQISVPPAEA